MTANNENILKNISPIPLTEEQICVMESVCDMLLEKNKVMNLTAIRDRNDALVRHFADSLFPIKYGNIKGKVLDVGSGGGFPAFPLAIVTGCEVTSLDATKKKLDFIEETAKNAGITNINTLYGRAEELSLDEEYREKFDTVISRGVADFSVLCEWCLPFVKPGGIFIAMKGENGEAESQKGENAVKILGGSIESITPYSLENAKHVLINVRKIKNTDKKYPRKNSVIIKKPL